MEGKYIAGVAAILVAVILVGSVLAPVIDSVSGGAWDETVTTTYNEDPDLQFDKQTSDFALNMSVTIGDEVVITNGEDTVTATYGAMFLLAADNSAIFINIADDLIFTWSDNDGKHSLTLAGDFTAVIADDKLTINDGTAHDAPLPASYLYVPSSTGGYGSFASGELAKRAADPVIAAGSFAGAVAYNSSVTLVGDAVVMSVDGTDTLVNSVEWVAAPAAEPAIVPLDPSSITIQPLDPSVIDPEPDAGIMTVPTPTYTDGDWGYDLYTSGANNGKAKIVSYSGSGGTDIVIPATVGGYEVVTVGKGSGNTQVFDSSVNINGLIFSEGIKTIEWYAFKGCYGLSGHISLSSTITTIGDYSFGYTAIESIDIPESVTTIGNGAFNYCTSLKNVVVPASVTSIGSNAFAQTYTGDGLDTLVILGETVTMGSNVTNGNTFKNLISFMGDNSSLSNTAFTSPVLLKNVLNFGTLELTTTSYGLNADLVQDYIGADVYIAPATITEVIHHSGGSGGSMGAMYAAIPVVILAAILLAAVSMFVIRRGM